tara:strand:+ start:60 stop:521 length:462 start_codon:yes stop_codon:yes gene_type:complete
MANYYGGMMGAMGGDIGNAAAVDVAGIFKKKMQQTDPRLQTGYEQQLEFNTLRNRKEAFDKLKKDIGGIGDGLVNIPGAAGNIAGISFDINESPKNRKMRAIKNLSETGVGGEKEAAIEKLKQMGGPQLPLAMGNPLYQMGNMAGVYGPVPFS